MSVRTLADHAYHELRRRILSSELPAGQRLFVDQLARELDVSPSPVKEALKQLEANGLVEIESRRATRVRAFTASDVADIYNVREMLEPAAAVQALARGAVTAKMLAALAETIERMERASHGDRFADPAAVLQSDSDFHRLIVDAAGNRVLSTMHATLTDQSHIVRMFSTRSPRARDTLAEHRRILEALVVNDSEAARAASLAHLRSARSAVLAQISEAEATPQQET